MKGHNNTFMMASHNFVYILNIVIFICVCNIERLCDASSCEKSSSKFLVEPTNVQVRRYENAMFQCSAAEHDYNLKTKSIKWKVYPDPNTSPMIDEIYDAVKRILTSNFTIQNSSGHTQFYISCILEETIQQETLCFSSRPALMDIMYFPKKDDLSCDSSFNNVAHLGETLSLTCKVLRGNPPVDMAWTVLPGGTMFPSSLHDEGSLRVLSYDLFITRDLHLQRILCVVSSAFSFPGEKLHCSIGPVKVYHPPEVHIFPQTISIMSLDHVELTCTADAYPEVQNFTWTCFPEAILKGCGIVSSSRHSFTFNTTDLCTSKIEGVHITCSATNSEGRGVGFAYLDITKNIENICQNTDTIYQENVILSSKVDLPNLIKPNLISLLKNKQKPCLTSFEYSGATPMSNHERISVNGQLTEYTTNKVTTSIYSEQSILDILDLNKSMMKPFMMMVISGAVLLIAIIMIIISLYLCRVNRKTEKEIDSSSDIHTQQPQTTSSHTIPAYCTNIDIVNDSLYEVPNAHSEQTTADVFATYSSSSSTGDISGTFNQNIHHDYYLADSYEISSIN